MYDYLWLNASLTHGGSERVMSLLASGFAERGLKSRMVLLREGKNVMYDVSPRLETVQMHYRTTNRALLFLIRLIRIRKMVKQDRPKAVICFMWDLNAVTLLACLGLKCRVLVSERAFPLRGRQGLHRRFTQNWLYRTAYRVVLQTEDVKQYYPKKVQEKAIVIPNPIRSDLQPPWEGERKKEIVAAGRCVEQKNFPLLRESFAAFHETHPTWRLTIYGGGRLQSLLEEKIRQLGLGEAVNLPGVVKNLPDRIRDAGMFVSSSDFEGISNVMLEAMASGLPSICTDCPVGGAAMVIQDGVNGMLVPVGNREELTRAMARVADDPAFAEKIGREALGVRERFALDRVVQQWAEACGDS